VAISFIASSGVSGATGTEPTGTQLGDLMIANVLSTSTPVAPVGSPWMALGAPVTANGYTVIHYWMIRGSSAPSYTWTGMAGANDGVTIATFRSVNSAPIEAVAFGSSGSAVMPSVNPSASSDWLVCSYADASATTVTAPSGMTLIDGDLGCLAYQNLGSAAATGTKTWGATSLPIGGCSILVQYVSTNAIAPLYPRLGKLGPMPVRKRKHFRQNFPPEQAAPFIPPFPSQQIALPRTRPLLRRRVVVVKPVPAQEFPTQGVRSRTRQVFRPRNVRQVSAPIPQALRAAIPGYFYPTLGGWATMCTYPNQPAVIIANIGGSGGPGTSVNSDYTTWITNAVQAGIKVIGYVDTNYATRTIGTSSDTASSNTVYGDINGWKTLYPDIGGYFLDRVPTASGAVLTTTQTTITYARSVIQGAPIFANCGAYPTVSGYIDAADVTVVFEGDYNLQGYPTTVPGSVPGYVANYPAAKFMHLVYNCASVQAMQTAVGTAISTNTGWLYTTDASALLNNLATYWATPERFDLWTRYTQVDPAPALAQVASRRSGMIRSLLRLGMRSDEPPFVQLVVPFAPASPRSRPRRIGQLFRRPATPAAPVDQLAASVQVRQRGRHLPRFRRPVGQVVPPQVGPSIVVQAVKTRPRAVFRPRMSQQQPTPPQFNPIISVQPTQQRRRFGFARRRISIWAPPIDQPTPTDRHASRPRTPAFRFRRPIGLAVPPQFNPVINIRPAGTRARTIFRPRPGVAFPVPTQVIVPWAPQGPKIKRWLTPNRRGTSAQVTPSQFNPVDIPHRNPSRTRTAAFRLRRPAGIVTPPQFNPVVVVQAITSRARRIFRPRPGFAAPTPNQIPPPPFVAQGPRLRRSTWAKRGYIAPPTQSQQNPVINIRPVIPRRLSWGPRRGRSFTPTAPQANPAISIQPILSRARRVFRPRPGTSTPVPPQVVPLTYVPVQTARRRLALLLRSRRQQAPVAPQERPLPTRTPHPVAPMRRPRMSAGPPIPQVAPPLTPRASRIVPPARRGRLANPMGYLRPNPPFVSQRARQAWRFVSKPRYGWFKTFLPGGIPPSLPVRFWVNDYPQVWTITEPPLYSTPPRWAIINPITGGLTVIRQSSLSTEFIRYQVQATLNGMTYNPTADIVQFAFLPLGTYPSGGSWVAGSWETTTQFGGTQYLARCLVGPTGTTTLTKGDYVVWIKIADTPEVPVRNLGTLQIT
jgi:Spherulation-specific family 4